MLAQSAQIGRPHRTQPVPFSDLRIVLRLQSVSIQVCLEFHVVCWKGAGCGELIVGHRYVVPSVVLDGLGLEDRLFEFRSLKVVVPRQYVQLVIVKVDVQSRFGVTLGEDYLFAV